MRGSERAAAVPDRELHLGTTVLNGEVTSGWSAGSQVHEEGLLVDPDTLTFEGTLQVMSP